MTENENDTVGVSADPFLVGDCSTGRFRLGPNGRPQIIIINPPEEQHG